MKILISNLTISSVFSPQPLINLISILLITISCLFSYNFVGAVDQYFQNCSISRFCGSQPISFPFYFDDEHNYCGYPGFRLSCNYSNGYRIPILNFYGDEYIVHTIFYENQSLIVSNAAFSHPNKTACLPPLQNLSIPTDFYLSSKDSNVTLLQNCSSSAVQTDNDLLKYKIGCSAENESNLVLALPENDEKEVEKAYEKCGNGSSKVDVPIMGYSRESEDMTTGLLSRGFMLNWTASSCSYCNSTGGKCGFDFPTFHFKCYCPDRPHAARCDPPRNKKLALKLGLGIGLSVFIIGSVTFFLIWLYKQRRSPSKFVTRSVSDPYLNDPEGGSVYYGVHVFSYKDLEEATNNFDTEKELGDGGFGTVYLGRLKDGREVAVKRLYEHNYKRFEQFKNEIEILARLRHQNLVTLYGCTSRRCRELLLVYEYIPNGTVADHLHGDRVQTSPLTWPVRMSIAIETATALAYLHASDIVHRDVKTNNILLDNNFCVKVADFGLSRLFPIDVTHVSTAPQGTPGYVDPEYHQCYQLTSKSDVYSFGVVLVELISSMPAVDITRHRHEINLSNLAISKIKKRAYNELVDPRLGFDTDSEAKRMTIAVAELAFQCLQKDKETRPSMDDVLEELKRIESGKSEPENQVKGFDGVIASTQPPPSPEHCDEVGLLKSIKEQPPSPNTVTENWSSSLSSTSNVSG